MFISKQSAFKCYIINYLNRLMKMIYSVTECSIIYSKIVTNTFTPCCKNLNVMKVITDKNNNLIPLKGSG